MSGRRGRGRPSGQRRDWREYGDLGVKLSTASSASRTNHATFISNDGLRLRQTSFQAAPRVERAPSTSHSSTSPDDFSSWTPTVELLDDDHSPSMNARPASSADDSDEGDIISPTGSKRKRYQSSDDPMGTWVPFSATFLQEFLRRDGLGDEWGSPSCTTCGIEYVASSKAGFFRCSECLSGLQCRDCTLKGHRNLPLHLVDEWNGQFWEHRSLHALGLVYDLGHYGYSCPALDPTRDFTIIHTNGMHRVRVRYCTCRSTHAASNVEQLLRVGWYPATVTDPQTCATFQVLDAFRLLNVIGSVSCEAFYNTLVELSDPCGFNDLPDRYVAFSRMERQYAYLLRVKRSGRLYRLPAAGDVAVLCWGCPQDGLNLPKEWRDVSAESQFLYMLIVAMDANFRLKNRIRKNEKGYPSLGSGSAYFVPSTAYKEHIKNYVVEEDVSTCIAFAALLEKDTKITTGLRTSGVAGVVCARHELVRPLGIGDLQKGERYSNMDYVLLSSIQDTPLQRVTVSYDVSCQWKINLRSRIPHLPAALHLDSKVHLQHGIPTWHAAVHELSCRMQNALGYQEGVGRTDGEGIERTWASLNKAAWSTKEMGEGARHDHLDDKIDHHNYRKNLALGDVLARRLIIARDECARQKANFEALCATLKPDVRRQWQGLIDAWNKDRSSPNPYCLGGDEKNPSEAQVRASLKKEEAAEAAAGKVPRYTTTAASCLGLAMHIERLQYKILDVSASPTLSLEAESKIAERRVGIFAKLKQFRNLQRQYMPGAARAMADEASSRVGELAPLAEHIKLWLPSDMAPEDRPASLAPGLAAAEARLREAQCADALAALCQHLHSKQYLIAWRDANAVGQAAATRSRTLIDSVAHQVQKAASKYRRARAALVSLRGEANVTVFKPLLDSDLASDIVVEDDALAQRRLALAKGKNKRVHVSTGKDTVSWIWTLNVKAGDRNHLDECVRVKWSKSQLRVKQWTQEVQLLQEEMRRVLHFLLSMEKRWTTYAGLEVDVKCALDHGQHAYALKQADVYRRLRQRFVSLWSSPFGKDKVSVASVQELVDQDVD